jgi:Mg2+ and Co2+ transporter CorA
LFGILDYANAQANKELTLKAQNSAQQMENMTNRMMDIAIKTEQETVVMRIVTVVTLFFLPATFVSVSFVNFD